MLRAQHLIESVLEVDGVTAVYSITSGFDKSLDRKVRDEARVAIKGSNLKRRK